MANFKPENCNGWLVQLSWAQLIVTNPNEDRELPEFWGQRLAYIWLSFAITFIAWAILIFMACTQSNQEKKKKHQLHMIMFWWLLVQIWQIFIATDMYLNVTDRVPIPDEDLFTVELRRLTWIDSAHQLTVGLIYTIWDALSAFKRLQLDNIQDKSIQTDLQATLRKEKIVGFVFAFANLAFQLPLFIIIIIQLIQTLNNQTFQQFMPQQFNEGTVQLAVLVAVLSCLFIVVYLVLMVWHLISLMKVITLTVHDSTAKIAFYVSIPILIVLYINDVFRMMLFYWGAPALGMTGFTMDGTIVINGDEHCRSFLTIDDGTADNQSGVEELTHLGQFTRLIFLVSEITPIIWSVVFFVGLIWFQHVRFGSDPLDYHEENAKQRKAHMDNINVSNTTGQMTIDQSGQDLR